MTTRRAANESKIGPSVELAKLEEPPVDLKSYIRRLRDAGATEVYVSSITAGGVFIEAATVEVAKARRSAITARSRRVVAMEEIEWESGGAAAFAEALDRLVTTFQQFDKISRFRFAASDMWLVAHAAKALVDARENDGPARLYERIIETGMVVTYARPFLESNEAPIGRKWWPRDKPERELHDELLGLRHEYHAHAGHTPRRRLENATTMLGREGRAMFVESWEELPSWKLRPDRRSRGTAGQHVQE